MASYQGYPNGPDRLLLWGKQTLRLYDESTVGPDFTSVARSGYAFTGASPYNGFESWFDQIASEFTDWWQNTQGNVGTFSFEVESIDQEGTNGLKFPKIKLVLTGGDGTEFSVEASADGSDFFGDFSKSPNTSTETVPYRCVLAPIFPVVASDKRKYPTRKTIISGTLNENMNQTLSSFGNTVFDTSLNAYINFSRPSYVREFQYKHLKEDAVQQNGLDNDDLYMVLEKMGSRPVLVVHEEGEISSLGISTTPLEGIVLTSFNIDAASDHMHSAEGPRYTVLFEGSIIFTERYDL